MYLYHGRPLHFFPLWSTAWLGTKKNLDWKLFSFRTWNTSLHTLLTFRVSSEKSALMYLPFNVAWHFSFTDYDILSLFSTFNHLTIISCSDVLLGSWVFAVPNASFTWMSCLSQDLGHFLLLFLLKRFSMPQPISLSFPRVCQWS